MADAVIEAIKKAIEGSKPLERKFKQTLDLAINLKEIDLKNPKNRMDENVLLPKGRGKAVKVGAFGAGEFAMKAKKAADYVLSPADIDNYAANKKQFKKIATECRYFIAEANLMVPIGKKLGAILAVRGKMPMPYPSNIDPAVIINNLKNTVKAKTPKDSPVIHVAVGTEEMSPEDIAENIHAVIERVEKKLERGKQNVRSIHIKTTMGPDVRLR